MSILSVHDLQGIAAYSNKIRIPSGHQLSFDGNLKIPVWTTGTRPVSPEVGLVGYNSTTKVIEIYDGTAWATAGSAAIGTQENPSISGAAIKTANASATSGLYWIKPTGQTTAYQMYVDMTRNSGGWVLCARVTTASCQAHITRSSVNFSGTTGPRLDNTTTVKMADTWIQALRTSSSYTGSTAYWMENTTVSGRNVFISSLATVNLEDAASGDNERTRLSLTYEGSLSDMSPNTGTRGFGDHHTSSNVYFAWGRHPEQGGNCGFREDGMSFSDGYLWVK